MAYGLKYTQYISNGGTTLRVNVYAKDWTGATYGMAHVLGASMQIVGGQADIISPIIKTAFSWSLADAWDQGATQADGTTCVNAQGEKCGRWEEFYTKDATKFRVEVMNGSTVIWRGYVTPDSWTEEMQFHGSVTITARDMLGALQDSEFDLIGRVTVLDVVQGALEACSCPMELYYVPAHFLVNENGQSILAHDFAASTFSGRNWYQTLEDTLDSLGLVLRYNGAGQIVLTSLRYLAADTLQGHHEVAYANRSGLRSLDPAIKLITETFDLERTSYVPKDPDASQFTATGGTITCSMTVTRPGSTPQTATGVVKAYTLTRTGSEGWSGTLGIPMYGTAESGAVIRGIYFPCGTQDVSNTLEAVYTNTRLDRAFRFSLALDGGLMQVTNGATADAVFKAPLTSSFIYVPDVTIRVQCVAEGVTYYLNSEGVWVTDLTYRSIQLGETVTVPMHTNGTNYQIVVKRVNLAGTGRPLAPLVAPLLLEVGPDDNATSPTEYKITTNYDQENNVTITRSPVIGSADVAECPEFIANALGYDDVIVSNKWNWPGEASYFPLAVMIQAQVLCFYAAAASVFTGTAVDRAADFALPGYAFDYYSRRGVPVSGVYDLSSGFAVQSTVREVYSWEEVWGESFAPEYTQISGAGKGSTSATGSGGSSSGGSGGGSIAPGVSMAAVQEWVNGQGFATETWVTAKGYLTGITEDMIADALGYTPLAPDDLLGYATQSWVTSQGYLTGITATDIETALDYIPVSPTDLTTALGGYLPLTAGTAKPLTGDLYIITGDTDKCIQFSYDTRHLAGAAWRIISEGTGTGDTNYLSFQTGGSSASATTWETVLRMTMDTRRVGINTTPSYQLDVNGPTRVTSLRIGTTTNAAASLLEWDETNRAWKLTGNFYATGWISAGGLSSGGGSEGASLAAVWASLKTNSDDYANEKINAYHIPIGSGLSVVNGLIVANNAGTVTSVKVGTTTYNPTDGVVSLPAYPTTLPASDVYAWAKASTKPSYAFSEITGTASTSQIPTLAISKISGLQDALNGKQASDADLTAIAGLSGTSGFLKKTAANTWALDTNTYLTGITSTMVTTALGYTPANVTALANYLPLTGGTLTQPGAARPLRLNSTVSSNVSGLVFAYNNTEFSGIISYTNEGYLRRTSGSWAEEYIIWDAGNSNLATVNWAANQMTAQSFKLAAGAPTLTWDATNSAWHLSGNFYADGWISAGGVSSGGGASGIDLAAMWASLTNSISDAYAAIKIAAAHIPDMSGAYGYLKESDQSAALANYLPLTGGTLTQPGAARPLRLNSTVSSNVSGLVFAYNNTEFSGIISYTNEGYLRRTSGSWAEEYVIYDSGNFVAGTNYQAPISDLSTIRSNASNGNAAYNALGNYVLKTGDVMTGDLTLRNSALQFQTADGTTVGRMSADASHVLSWYDQTAWRTILHSGNYTSYTPILNSASIHATNTSVIYAPTTSGNAGQILLSTGAGAPAWSSVARGASNKPIYIDSAGVLTEGVACLALTGGTMTGNLSFSPASGVSTILFYESGADVGHIYASGSDGVRLYQPGTGSPGFAIKAGLPNPIFRYFGVDYTVYHSGNSNLSTVPWACSTLTASGNATIAGNVGIGTTSPGAPLEVLNGADPGSAGHITAQFLSYSSSPYGIVLRGYSSGVHAIQVERKGTSSEFFPLALQHRGGNVGIGTTSPAYKLDVNGTARISGVLTATAFYAPTYLNAANISTAGWYRVAKINSATRGASIMMTLCHGFNYNQTQAFTFSISIGYNSANITQLSGDVANKITKVRVVYESAGVCYIDFYTNATNSDTYWVSGAIIGDGAFSAPASESLTSFTASYSLDVLASGMSVSGNLVATGAITAGAASDARLKTNIRALSADAAKRIVMGLNPVTFTWNARATELYDRYKGDDLGMIAQEVEPYLPQAIGTIFECYKRLDYNKVVTPLVKVAQDHETRLAQAEGRIAALERENAELKRKLFAC